MSLKSLGARIFAGIQHRRNRKWIENPLAAQEKVLQLLLKKGAQTAFGKDHGFKEIRSHAEFAENVPVRDYEQVRDYVDCSVAGEPDVLWPGKPLYFAKTSGTTSGAKYIPLTQDSMPEHIQAARDAILAYIHDTGKAGFVDGKMIFLQGSPELDQKNGTNLGRLSGIVAHYVPKYLQKNRMPSWQTNIIEDWETKVEAIIDETIVEDMSVISGIPSWVQMYFERIVARTGKPVGEVFPNFNLFIYGGVNYEPYRKKFEQLIGRKVDSIELFPASEGFFAYQNQQNDHGLLLLLDAGIYYEFIPLENYGKPGEKRLNISQVVTGVNYVLIISTTAGLWAYNIGDTVMFTSVKPFKLVVTGRIKHYISASGEHVIGKEVEEALKEAVGGFDLTVNEFTVAPQLDPPEGELPYHEWFIEFGGTGEEEYSAFAKAIDHAMQEQNIYYKDLIQGNILQPVKITPVPKNGFNEYMSRVGRLGGQNKIPRLSNDRKIAEVLEEIID